MARFFSGDFDKGSDGLSLLGATQCQTEQIGEGESEEQTGQAGRGIFSQEHESSDAEVSLPISEALFNGHALGIKIDDLTCGQRDPRRDQEIPGFSVSLSPKDDQI